MGLKWLPNAVTVARCLLALAVGYVILQADVDIRSGQGAGLWLFLPFILFVVAAGSDWIDGALARGLNAESQFGARLDPIADKLLAASSLIAMCYVDNWSWYLALPTVAIVGRDFLMTAMREAMGNPTQLKVTRAAKWKTAIVLTAIAAVLLGVAVGEYSHATEPFSPLWLLTQTLLIGGLGGIWIAAVLSVMTAFQYVSAAMRQS